jgi:hypothetical protein
VFSRPEKNAVGRWLFERHVLDVCLNRPDGLLGIAVDALAKKPGQSEGAWNGYKVSSPSNGS